MHSIYVVGNPELWDLKIRIKVEAMSFGLSPLVLL
jgi:hypothetical protein